MDDPLTPHSVVHPLLHGYASFLLTLFPGLSERAVLAGMKYIFFLWVPIRSTKSIFKSRPGCNGPTPFSLTPRPHHLHPSFTILLSLTRKSNLSLHVRPLVRKGVVIIIISVIIAVINHHHHRCHRHHHRRRHHQRHVIAWHWVARIIPHVIAFSMFGICWCRRRNNLFWNIHSKCSLTHSQLSSVSIHQWELNQDPFERHAES